MFGKQNARRSSIVPHELSCVHFPFSWLQCHVKLFAMSADTQLCTLEGLYLRRQSQV